MSQCMTKPAIWLVQPAKTQISLRIRAVWSESSLIACAFYSLQAIQRGTKENPCRTGWKYRLTFAGHTGLIVGFVVHRLKYKYSMAFYYVHLTFGYVFSAGVLSNYLDIVFEM